MFIFTDNNSKAEEWAAAAIVARAHIARILDKNNGPFYVHIGKESHSHISAVKFVGSGRVKIVEAPEVAVAVPATVPEAPPKEATPAETELPKQERLFPKNRTILRAHVRKSDRSEDHQLQADSAHLHNDHHEASMSDEFDLHGQVIAKIHHEDFMLQQRTYNFLTANVFLVAGLGLQLSRDGMGVPTRFAIAVLGLLLSICQVALGRRTERAILFWRVYASILENKLGLPLDSALFNFYENPDVKVVGGRIVAGDRHKRPMYQTFPWSLAFMPSTNIVIGVLIPSLMALFWAIISIFISGAGQYITVGTILILLYLWFIQPASPKALESDANQ